MRQDQPRIRVFLRRIEAIEHRLARAAEPGADRGRIEADLTGRRAEFDAILRRISALDARMDAMGSADGSLGEIAQRIEWGMTARILRLEKEISRQRDALLELERCSTQTERTMQKLLGSVMRLVSETAPTQGSRM